MSTSAKMFSSTIFYFGFLVLGMKIIAAKTKCPFVSKLNIFPGSGWDALANRAMNQTLHISYNQCKVTSDGKYLIPDDTEVVLMKTMELEVKGDLIEHWSNFTPPSASGFHVISDIWPVKFQPLYFSFSEDYQKVKETLVKYNEFICRSQLRHLLYRIHTKPNAPLDTRLKTKFLDIIDALTTNQKEKAECILETIVRDYGTHYTTSADIGAALIKEDLLPMSFLADHYQEKWKILSASKASFSSYGFSWSDKHYLDTSLVKEYNKAIIESRITVIGGPNWRMDPTTDSTYVIAGRWLANTKKNMTLYDRSGDLLTGLITPSKFPDISKANLKKLQDMLGTVIRNYYSRNIYEGCTQKTAQNFDFAANLDDDSCFSGSRNYEFGGLYQKCTDDASLYEESDEAAACLGYVINNPLTGDTTCPLNFEEKFLLTQSHLYTYTSPLCQWNCKTFYGLLTIGVYFCINSEHLSSQRNHYEFGGLYSAEADNIQTEKKNCPPYYSTYSFLDEKLVVCLSSYANESSQQNSLAFGGFSICQTVVCCSGGYKAQLATIYQGHNIYYCIRELNLSVVKHRSTPILSQFPFADCTDNDSATVISHKHITIGDFKDDFKNDFKDEFKGDFKGDSSGYSAAFHVLLILVVLGLALGLSYYQRKRIVENLRLALNYFHKRRNNDEQQAEPPASGCNPLEGEVGCDYQAVCKAELGLQTQKILKAQTKLEEEREHTLLEVDKLATMRLEDC